MTAAVIKFERPAPQIKLPEKNRPEDSPLAFKGDADAAYLRTLFSETYWTLPFVTMPAEHCDSWGEFWQQVVMWNDERTDDPYKDYQRGRKYAYLAIDAIQKDGTCNRQLEITVELMLKGAFRRRGPSGNLGRSLSNAESGFMESLCLAAVRPNDLVERAKREGWR